jgi:hypothetical protein
MASTLQIGLQNKQHAASIRQTKTRPPMKKLILLTTSVMFLAGFSGCGGSGHHCEAYGKAAYKKVNTERHINNIKLIPKKKFWMKHKHK